MKKLFLTFLFFMCIIVSANAQDTRSLYQAACDKIEQYSLNSKTVWKLSNGEEAKGAFRPTGNYTSVLGPMREIDTSAIMSEPLFVKRVRGKLVVTLNNSLAGYYDMKRGNHPYNDLPAKCQETIQKIVGSKDVEKEIKKAKGLKRYDINLIKIGIKYYPIVELELSSEEKVELAKIIELISIIQRHLD